MAAVSTSPMNLNMIDSTLEVDKLTYEIFSILENKFLFGYTENDNILKNSLSNFTPKDFNSVKHTAGKVRVLCIDGAGSTAGILAAKSLSHLEACLRRKSGNPNTRVADYFDAVAGSGVGGILTALLFTRGKDGLPIFTAEEALKFLIDNRRRISSPAGMLLRLLRPAAASKAEKLFRKTFGECTLKDTLKPVLIPCYDLATRAPFVFSRADALEMDGYDFKMHDVCSATSADPASVGPTEMRSVDGRTKIVAVDGGIAMNNPTAAAITHVLNNKHEFPFCNGVSDMLVLSLGNGESDFNAVKSPAAFVRIAGEGASDMVRIITYFFFLDKLKKPMKKVVIF